MNNIDLISIRFSNARLPGRYLQKIEAGVTKICFPLSCSIMLRAYSGSFTRGKSPPYTLGSVSSATSLFLSIIAWIEKRLIDLPSLASGTKISTKGKNTIERPVCRIYVFIVLTNPSPKRSKSAVKDYYPYMEFWNPVFIKDTKGIRNFFQPEI